MVDGEADQVTFTSQNGWNISSNGQNAVLHGPSDPAPGLAYLQASVDGTPAWQINVTSYPHIGRTVWREPAVLPVLALDVKLPDARIGYIGGGTDNVGLWLKRMGFEVTDIEPHHLAGDLSEFTTIVVGIFAFGLRDDLTAATTKLHRFVDDGGHLVTLYHRPTDGWQPDRTPPRKLSIGSPSLRWRVTNPNAPVTMLVPEHPLLVGPNIINEHDWEGWQRNVGSISLLDGMTSTSRCFPCMMTGSNRFSAHSFQRQSARAAIPIQAWSCIISSTSLFPVHSGSSPIWYNLRDSFAHVCFLKYS